MKQSTPATSAPADKAEKPAVKAEKPAAKAAPKPAAKATKATKAETKAEPKVEPNAEPAAAAKADAKADAKAEATAAAAPKASKAKAGESKSDAKSAKAAPVKVDEPVVEAAPPAPKPSTPSVRVASPAKPPKPKPVFIDVDDPYAALDAMTDEEFLAAQRTLLEQERRTYSSQALMLRAEADQLAADMEPGDVQFDDESGEGAGTTIERERDLAMSAQAALTVEEIDRALARLDAGDYGICSNCNKPIPRARLSAMPYATLCISCKSGGLSRR